MKQAKISLQEMAELFLAYFKLIHTYSCLHQYQYRWEKDLNPLFWLKPLQRVFDWCPLVQRAPIDSPTMVYLQHKIFEIGDKKTRKVSSCDERLFLTMIWKGIKERERPGFDPSTLDAVRLITWRISPPDQGAPHDGNGLVQDHY